MVQENLPIVVTGATGFIGINLVKYLVEQGRRVIGLDIVTPDSLIADYLHGLEDSVDWVQIDLTDAERVLQIADEYLFDKIIHAAVFTPASQDVERANPRRILTSNLMGTVNILELARQAKVNRFVYVSSSGVYGSTSNSEQSVHVDSLQPFTRTGGFSGFYGIRMGQWIARPGVEAASDTPTDYSNSSSQRKLSEFASKA
jgi:nucleoside-diphosphate-sugar epimerase